MLFAYKVVFPVDGHLVYVTQVYSGEQAPSIAFHFKKKSIW
jgi:hypothetical protein